VFGSYLDPSIIRRPRDEGDLASLALARRQVVCEIVHGVSWALGQRAALCLGLGVDELLPEPVPVRIFRSIFYHNLLIVIRELEDDVFDSLSELELVELRDALLRDGDTGET
jgi:hypothetical protein